MITRVPGNMPSYTFVPPYGKRYPANEEISMYIEDSLERELYVEDQTPIAFKISPGATKYYITTLRSMIY
ncbi:MAG: hypothetical protein J7M18_03710 [Candidatus Eremiobacteraeota bacterium]|nr:hypothetical protein [Candidatus Eremiobacteraeota bacterium]